MNSSRSQSPSGRSVASRANHPPNFAVERQSSLFSGSNQVLPGSLNDGAMVRAILVDSIRKSGKSRESIAEEMSFSTGTEITVRRLNGFTAESAEDYRFPAELDRAFCIATGDFRLLRCRVEAAGFRVITQAEVDLLELGRQFLIRSRAEEKVSLLERRLAGIEVR